MTVWLWVVLVVLTGLALGLVQWGHRRLDNNRKVLDWALEQARRHNPVAFADAMEQCRADDEEEEARRRHTQQQWQDYFEQLRVYERDKR